MWHSWEAGGQVAGRSAHHGGFFFVKEEWRRGAEVERRAPTTMHIGGEQPSEGHRVRTDEARLCDTQGRRVALCHGGAHTMAERFFLII